MIGPCNRFAVTFLAPNCDGFFAFNKLPVVDRCDATEEVYDTALLLNVSAAFEPGQTISDETFGDSLIASYNDLSTSLCDPWNRKLRRLRGQPDTVNRRLTDGIVSIHRIWLTPEPTQFTVPRIT